MSTESKTKTTRDPWKPAIPGLNQASQDATGLYNQGEFGKIEPFSPASQSALRLISERGENGSPLQTQASNFASGVLTGNYSAENGGAGLFSSLGQLQQTAQGDFLGPNEHLNQYLDVGSARIADQVDRSYSRGGRYGSASHDLAVGRSIGEFQSPLLAQNYRAERQNQLNAANTILGAQGQAANYAGEAQRIQYQDYNALLGAGQLQQGQAQREQDADITNLMRFFDMQARLGGLGGQSTSTTSQSAASNLAGVGLGALSGGLGALAKGFGGQVGGFAGDAFSSGVGLR